MVKQQAGCMNRVKRAILHNPQILGQLLGLVSIEPATFGQPPVAGRSSYCVYEQTIRTVLLFYQFLRASSPLAFDAELEAARIPGNGRCAMHPPNGIETQMLFEQSSTGHTVT